VDVLLRMSTGKGNKMNTIFNIFTDDKIKSIKEDRFIKLEITHWNCQEPFLELYVQQDKVSDIIKELENH
jgi:hypothetical protein